MGMKIRKGDTVQVIAGDDKGKVGKVLAVDEENQCRVGDVVRIMETRPLSRNKRWRLLEIVERAE